MKALRMHTMRTGSTSPALLLLAICRAVYCWAFLALSCMGLHAVYSNIQELLQKHSADKGDIVGNAILAIYAVILGVAWWMIFRGKPALKRWAIAANSVIVFVFLPILLFGGWRPFWEDEQYWFPASAVGVLGMIIFSIPYRGWRQRPR